MKKLNILLQLLMFLLLFPATGAADEYAFDVTEFAPQKLEINYRLDLRPTASWLAAGSRLYQLTLAADSPRRSQSQYSILAGTSGSYKTGQNSAFIFDGLLTFNRNMGKNRASETLNEAWMRFDVNSRLQLGIGKKTIKWGKGYAWNPVNFFGRQKDLNDMELALAGYGMLFSQYSRTLSSGPISNMTLTMAYLPVAQNINDNFTDSNSHNFASQLYLLHGDTDIDLYLMAGSSGNHKLGMDFSRNLASNLEIHAEIAHERHGKGFSIAPTGLLSRDKSCSTSLIAGGRYLDHREITYIFEYIHNDSGFSQNEMNSFYNYVDAALNSGSGPLKRAAAYDFSTYINRQFPMQDYLYFKASKPELFNNLYLNGAVFTVFNAADSSTSTSLELNYTGMTDEIITLRLTKNEGNRNSEFGQKLNSDKAELRYQVFF